MEVWKNSRHRKPLLLWGARQTGKTWLLKEFGRLFFKNTVYISFYNNRKMAGIFENDYDIRDYPPCGKGQA
ncbi:MAG: AAA family ATPase [Lachnospiraceae bacterium]|nr:AAA family ATPase [Lachnospiraceae bacterium]